MTRRNTWIFMTANNYLTAKSRAAASAQIAFHGVASRQRNRQFCNVKCWWLPPLFPRLIMNYKRGLGAPRLNQSPTILHRNKQTCERYRVKLKLFLDVGLCTATIFRHWPRFIIIFGAFGAMQHCALFLRRAVRERHRPVQCAPHLQVFRMDCGDGYINMLN